jgi:hypothetical protein
MFNGRKIHVENVGTIYLLPKNAKKQVKKLNTFHHHVMILLTIGGNNMMKTFRSKQTQSVYIVVWEKKVKIGYRELENGMYRVRIEGLPKDLKIINDKLFVSWGDIKSSDHLSIEVSKSFMHSAIADVIRAILMNLI